MPQVVERKILDAARCFAFSQASTLIDALTREGESASAVLTLVDYDAATASALSEFRGPRPISSYHDRAIPPSEQIHTGSIEP